MVCRTGQGPKVQPVKQEKLLLGAVRPAREPGPNSNQETLLTLYLTGAFIAGLVNCT